MKFTFNDVSYSWAGGFGSILTSKESNIKPGDCRVIKGKLFYCYMITIEEMFFLRKIKTVHWVFVDKFEIEDIRKFKQVLVEGL